MEMTSNPKRQRPSGEQQVDRDFETYKLLLNLWAAENPVKTNKLQVLLAVNALLVSAISVSGGFSADNWYVYLAGAVFSFIWTFSIGRTALFQDAWQTRIRDLKDRHPEDARFTILETADERRRARRMLVLSAVFRRHLAGSPGCRPLALGS